MYKEIEKEKRILNQMISNSEKYSKILKQSQKVDKLLNKKWLKELEVI